MTTIIAGGPGDPEVTPLTNRGECAGNMTQGPRDGGYGADGLPATGAARSCPRSLAGSPRRLRGVRRTAAV
jgi:hypothetical protein